MDIKDVANLFYVRMSKVGNKLFFVVSFCRINNFPVNALCQGSYWTYFLARSAGLQECKAHALTVTEGGIDKHMSRPLRGPTFELCWNDNACCIVSLMHMDSAVNLIGRTACEIW